MMAVVNLQRNKFVSPCYRYFKDRIERLEALDIGYARSGRRLAACNRGDNPRD